MTCLFAEPTCLPTAYSSPSSVFCKQNLPDFIDAGSAPTSGCITRDFAREFATVSTPDSVESLSLLLKITDAEFSDFRGISGLVKL